VEAHADEVADEVDFFKMDLAPNRQLLIDLEVSGLPTFLFFKNGQKAGVLAGNNITLAEIKTYSERLLR
jgi:thioredoxin 1